MGKALSPWESVALHRAALGPPRGYQCSLPAQLSHPRPKRPLASSNPRGCFGGVCLALAPQGHRSLSEHLFGDPVHNMKAPLEFFQVQEQRLNLTVLTF